MATNFSRAVTTLAAMAAAAALLLAVVLQSPEAASAQTAPACVPAPSSLAAWWRWEGNAYDSKNGNTATLFGNPALGTGKVGQAMLFDGVDDYAKVSRSPSLDVGLSGSGLTIEAWIKPSDTVEGALVEWNNGATGGDGVHLWTSHGGPGLLYANLVDDRDNNRPLSGSSSGFTTADFQHVALTYDRASGDAKLFRNGVLVGVNWNMGSFTPQTAYDLYFGLRPPGNPPHTYRPFMGAMDEIALYDRALTQPELQAIVTADSAGKCPLDTTAPVVSSVFPVKAATKVPRNVQPTATFSEEMRPDTFTRSNVRLTNQATKKRVPVAVSCDDPCTTVTIDPYPDSPSKRLAKRTKYKVVILGGSSGPKDLEGISMQKSEVWTFTTGRK